MTYAEAEDFLTFQLQNYRRTGKLKATVKLPNSLSNSAAEAKARKPVRDLPTRARILSFLDRIGNPHAGVKSRFVHVAGTNGKGTVSHLIAALSSAAGIKTGLYTSPHYASYRERIKIDGAFIPEAAVVAFVSRYHADLLELQMSYFEATAAMAFWYFAQQAVDLVVLEVGLGGTWDASNVIVPLLSVITNIGYDHQDVLGDTLAEISAEKAGIIKAHTPVVIGQKHVETHPVFRALAAGLRAPMKYAEDLALVLSAPEANRYQLQLSEESKPVRRYPFQTDLSGPFALENLRTALASWSVVYTTLSEKGQFHLHSFDESLQGLAKLRDYGYMGRFQRLQEKPLVICDAAHNAEAWEAVLPQIWSLPRAGKLHVVFGFKQGKMPHAFYRDLPADAELYACEASALAMPIAELLNSLPAGRKVSSSGRVSKVLADVLAKAEEDDVIFIGGSSYVVGDALAYWNKINANK